MDPKKCFHFSVDYFRGRKHNGRGGRAFSIIVSVRKRVSSDEEGVLHSLSTNSSVKGAGSKTFVPRSRRIHSAGSAEEEIMKANEERIRYVSNDGKPVETSYSKKALPSTPVDTDVAKDDHSFKVHQTDVGIGSYSEEDTEREPENTCIPRQARIQSTIIPIVPHLYTY